MINYNKKNTYCTLFDSNYLARGTILIDSLRDAVKTNVRINVLAMDDQCYAVLNAMHQLADNNSVVVIGLADFENPALLEAKQNRSFGEYCWTCTASLIEYVDDDLVQRIY